jgi:hypothetical protein
MVSYAEECSRQAEVMTTLSENSVNQIMKSMPMSYKWAPEYTRQPAVANSSSPRMVPYGPGAFPGRRYGRQYGGSSRRIDASAGSSAESGAAAE